MSFKNGPQIWFDGKLTRWEDVTVHVTAHALHYGSSVFEGIRAYQTEDGGTAIFRFGRTCVAWSTVASWRASTCPTRKSS